MHSVSKCRKSFELQLNKFFNKETEKVETLKKAVSHCKKPSSIFKKMICSKNEVAEGIAEHKKNRLLTGITKGGLF